MISQSIKRVTTDKPVADRFWSIAADPKETIVVAVINACFRFFVLDRQSAARTISGVFAVSVVVLLRALMPILAE